MAFSPAQVEQLLRPVNPRRVMQGNHGGRAVSNLAAYDVSAHLTRIFGFGGWSKHILSLELVAEDGIMDTSRNPARLGWWVTYRCMMRLEVGDWSNEDGATGSASNLPDRGDAHDFALKNAISYALKRCAKDLGDQFGLSLYNKGSTKALIGRTLTGSPTQFLAADDLGLSDVDRDVPDLAPDWDEQPPGRADGLPTNKDGSLSRSRTTDAEKDAAGVMTAAQQAEHTALQPKQAEVRGKVTRIKPDDTVAGPPDPWQDQPAGVMAIDEHWPPDEELENRPGTVSAQQQRAIHAACTDMDRAKRLATIGDIVGRQVTSSNELSWTEAAKVLAKLSGVPA